MAIVDGEFTVRPDQRQNTFEHCRLLPKALGASGHVAAHEDSLGNLAPVVP